MRVIGTIPAGLAVEVGNAWLGRPAAAPRHTNWVVGEFPGIAPGSLRHAPPGAPARGVALKWFVHDPADPPEWGAGKPTGADRTVSLLAGEGSFELTFWTAADPAASATVVLDEPGDYVAWGAGVEHTWRPLRRSTVVTLRWESLG